jgi:hypothetical protein
VSVVVSIGTDVGVRSSLNILYVILLSVVLVEGLHVKSISVGETAVAVRPVGIVGGTPCSAAVTVIIVVPVIVPLVALIVVVPTLTGINIPLESTVPTCWLLDVHVNVGAGDMVIPF